MLIPSHVRQHFDLVVTALEKRNLDAKPLLERLLSLDETRRATQAELDQTLAQSNSIAKEIGQLFKQGETDEANQKKDASAQLKAAAKSLQTKLQETADALQEMLYQLPNIPHESVPKGSTDEDNEEVFQKGAIPTLENDALPHWELAKKYKLIDFELGAKITGAGFPVYTGKGAKLQRALINYFLDFNTAAGYSEVQVPHMVNEASGLGTGQLPDKEGQMYHVTEDDLYLIPTAEVPVTNIYRDSLLQESELPIQLTAYTPCFRREAGSYGAHVRGLNRLHQFDKVELVRIEQPENSYNALDEMVAHVGKLLESLELPYRILRLCGGDLGFTSALTFDFEVYSTAQSRWLEVSSVSNFESFQANRLKLRYKTKEGKKQLAHTLNGSSLALPRIVAGLFENHQTADGIRIPKALIPYTGFDYIN
ncbi:MAG: serine--tRNA ligase [Bacteroidetes bacterium]|nr:serine--tRNA ligase [Bacteroidota bacterium]MDA0889176.1 serine--tRNA ligase [Bacteroidota bacterium]MDA1085004.1 serine--tRNA ligase [Bacteroidota bacterium]